LDEFDTSDNFSHLSHVGNNSIPQYEFSSYFDNPEPSVSDNYIFENGVAPILNAFDLEFDPMANYDNRELDNEFSLDDFLHNDEQPAPEIQSSDQLAETTASLQPQLGASSHGCDDGGNAVSV
jgi:transcriptional activator HAC1